MSNHDSTEHSSSHHHKHHKHHKKIPKNVIIITLAALVLTVLFIFMLQKLSQPSEEEQLQIYDGSVATVSPEAAKRAVAAETAAMVTSVTEKETEKDNVPKPVNKTAVNWCALGDSITYGYYSKQEQDGNVSVSITSREKIAWPYLVAEKNSWSLTNLAIGGEGYLIPANDGSENCGYKQARKTDFTPYNLVTVSLGINDWISNIPMGNMDDDPKEETISAFIPAMRATIEAIAESNPMCKIIVILPLNINGPDHSLGTKETNWAANCEMTSTGTLKQFSKTMIEVCELYGIQYIDMTTQSCINSISLPAMLPDGVHPAAETHKLLAGELAEKITFK